MKPDNIGEGDRWEDPRDTTDGSEHGTHEYRDLTHYAGGYAYICSCGWRGSPVSSTGVAYHEYVQHWKAP